MLTKFLKRNFIFLLLLFSVHSYAQNEHKSFGDITESEQNLTVCSFDSSASAVILFDIGESTFIRNNVGFKIQYKRHKRIKILNDEGKDNSIISIPYRNSDDGRKDKIRNIRAVTFNTENGVLTWQELKPESIVDEKFNDYYNHKKFVFPNVQKGSIIEYTYELTSPFIFNLHDWKFQNDIPTLYSEYKIHMIPFYDYVTLPQEIESFDLKTVEEGEDTHSDYGLEYHYTTHTYALKDIPAFKDESFITSKNDYIKKLIFQIAKTHQTDGTVDNHLTTWEALRKRMLSNEAFGRYIKKCKPYAKEILEEELDLSNLNDTQKVKAIVEYMKQNFYWNNYYAKFASQTPKEFYTSKEGSVADINLFLIALYREAGLTAYPVILSTRNHGKLNVVYPFAKSMNYVIAYVENSKLLTDATLKDLDYLLIPTNCINDYGLLVDDNEENTWLGIKYKSPSIEMMKINMTIHPEGLNAEVYVENKSNYFAAYKHRKNFGDNQKKIKNDLERRFSSVDSIKVEGYDNASKPYVLSYKADYKIGRFNNYLVIHPYLYYPLSYNSLTSEERSYPVDFIYPYKKGFQVSIEVPKGYTVESLPENVVVSNKLVSYKVHYDYDSTMNKVRIMASYGINKSKYEPDEYEELRKNIDNIIDVMKTRIELKKSEIMN